MIKGATKSIRAHAAAAVAAMMLAACGGGGGGGDAPNADPVAQAPQQQQRLGTNFAALGPSDVWHSMAASGNGNVLVAGQAGLGAEAAASNLSISTDGGNTWNSATGAPVGIWISADTSADGNVIAAVQFQGAGLYLSVNGGASFANVALPPGVAAGASWESVTVTRDGTRLAAVSLSGEVIVGNVNTTTGAVTWIAPAGLPAGASWRSIDSSDAANGTTVMVAVAQDPLVYRSLDGGATWTPVDVTVDGNPVTDQNWYRVKVSGDGNTVVMVANAFGGNSGDGIYVSKDQGGTFSRVAMAGDFSGIAMSADGGVIGVTMSDRNDGSATGSVQLSTNGGTSFAPLAITVDGVAAAETDWRTIAMASDATRLAVAAGRFITGGKGPIYVSTGTRP